MSNRLTTKLAATKKENRAALIPFIMGGDPNADASARMLAGLPGAGADIIEIGLPFSDPMADGPVIQAAGLRALAGGASVKSVLEQVSVFRKSDNHTPIVLMGYYNPLYRFGPETFCQAARAAGVDGLIVVDLPPEEEDEFRPHAERAGLALIRLIAPTSVPDRLKLLLTHAQGFAYYISIAGITGAGAANAQNLSENLSAIQNQAKLPVAVGFGVKTPEQAAEIGKQAGAVVVGSALVDILHKEGEDAALAFVGRLAQALKEG